MKIKTQLPHRRQFMKSTLLLLGSLSTAKLAFADAGSCRSSTKKLLKAANSAPLNNEQLHQLVTGNTLIGKTCNSKSLYELFFKKNEKVIFRKNNDSENQLYEGDWWLKENHIYSQWKNYTSKSYVLDIQYYPLLESVYIPYNVNDACGPAGTFGHAFMVFSGNILDL